MQFLQNTKGESWAGRKSAAFFFLLLPISRTKTLFPWITYMQRWKESWKTTIHHSCLSCAMKGSSSLPPSLLRYQRRLCFMISDTWDSLHALFSQGPCIPVRFQRGWSLDTSCPVLELPSLPGIPSSLEFHSSLVDKRKNCGNSMQPKGKKICFWTPSFLVLLEQQSHQGMVIPAVTLTLLNMSSQYLSSPLLNGKYPLCPTSYHSLTPRNSNFLVFFMQTILFCLWAI